MRKNYKTITFFNLILDRLQISAYYQKNYCDPELRNQMQLMSFGIQMTH